MHLKTALNAMDINMQYHRRKSLKSLVIRKNEKLKKKTE